MAEDRGAAPETSTKEPLKFQNSFPPLTLSEQIQRVSRYAQNSRNYLEDCLGKDTLQQREHLLSIPDPSDVVRDVYGSGAHKERFEQHIAKLLGKQHGLFFISGVQAQLAAIKIHCLRAQRSCAAWHASSHLETAELKSYRELYGLDRVLLGQQAHTIPTVAEIVEVLERPVAQRPATIILEIPNRMLGCATYSFAELQRISAACRETGVKLHMDGARLWEIEPYYGATADKSFADICALFDSVYVSMYKGLGGAAGAVLATDDPSLRDEAKIWQRRTGGNVVTMYYEVLDSERGYNENIGMFSTRRQKMLEISAGILEATKQYVNADGERIVRFIPETPTCCQTHVAFDGFTAEKLNAARDRLQQKMNIRLYEYLWPKDNLDDRLEKELRASTNGDSGKNQETSDAIPLGASCFEIEWTINSQSESCPTKTFIDAYAAFCRELLAEC